MRKEKALLQILFTSVIIFYHYGRVSLRGNRIWFSAGMTLELQFFRVSAVFLYLLDQYLFNWLIFPLFDAFLHRNWNFFCAATVSWFYDRRFYPELVRFKKLHVTWCVTGTISDCSELAWRHFWRYFGFYNAAWSVFWSYKKGQIQLREQSITFQATVVNQYSKFFS